LRDVRTLLVVGENVRTVIDLFRRGNQELFHSAMLAWLLDPQGEHGLQDAFLREFLHLASQRTPGGIELSGLDGARVETEVTVAGMRHDIVITTPHGQVIVENKTKSVARGTQLADYASLGHPLIPVGLTAMSFPTGMPGVLTYADVLDILSRMELSGPSDFLFMVRQYLLFLSRECGVLKALDRRFVAGPDDVAASPLVESSDPSLYRQNDLRVLNHYVLERFRRDALSVGPLAGSWRSEKNESSGVWVAGSPDSLAWHEPMEALLTKGTQLWFHIEFKAGPFAEGPTDKAGVLQLRGKTVGSNRSLLDGFVERFPAKGAFRHPRSLKKDAETFFLAQVTLQRSELPLPDLETRLVSFISLFATL
jgi:PD-(D/E)XK nuclease superfamily